MVNNHMVPLLPVTEKDNIAICYSTNELYVNWLGVSILSLMEHSSSEYFYDIVVLYWNLSERSRERLESLAALKQNVSIRFYDMSGYVTEYSERLKLNAWWTIEIYFKLFAAEVFRSYARILALDVDTVIEADVAQLYLTEMGGNWIAGCRDMLLHVTLKNEVFCFHFKNKLGMDKRMAQDPYINSGVLLLNLLEWRKCEVGEKVVQTALNVDNGDWIFPDQDVFNYVCCGHIKYLDLAWNLFPMDDQFSDTPPDDAAAWKEAYKNPKITHYVVGPGLSKPWINRKTELGWKWWSYARKLPYYEEVIKISHQ